MTTERSAFACGRVTLFCFLGAATVVAAPPGGERSGGALFTPDVYIEHIRYLASDALGGRDTGSPGIEQAGEYLAARFRELGLEPAGDDGTYFQAFDVRDGKKLVEELASLDIPGSSGTLKVGTDWTPMPFSAMDAVEAPLAFAGFGISAPDDDYDDFADFDATGKVLLVLRGEPKSADAKATIGGDEPSRHALFRTKARVAEKKGAKALLIVNAQREGDETDELYAFDPRLQSQTYEVPMLHLKREVADALLKKAGAPPLAELQAALEKDRKPLSRDLNGLTAKVHPGLEANVLKARNLIAKLPGESAPDEYIIIGAHYDHVGTRARQFQRRNTKPQIHNGADDNASGTAGLIELARVLSTGPRLRRSILFIAFSGEERGLLGSKHFVDNPTVPLEHVRAMLNFDMIGRLSLDRCTIYGTSSAKEFESLVEAAAADYGVKYKTSRDVPGNSDHAPFHRKKIPVLFPFTAMHKQYHQPEDDWERIDAGGAIRILNMAHDLIREIANMTDGPTWLDSEVDEDDIDDSQPKEAGTPDVSKLDANQAHAAAAAAAEKAERATDAARVDAPKDEPADAPSPRMPRVRLGIMPEYADTGKPGLGIEGLVEGGIAEKAGFKENDRIIQIGDKSVKDINDYMEVLSDTKPGDTVEFTLQRGEQKVSVKVTFPAASERPRRNDG